MFFQDTNLIPEYRKSPFTLRRWRATREYHRTKDILHVKEMLGHRQLSSTMIYTHLVHFQNDDYHVKTAKILEEACELAKVGFSYFTEIQGVQVFRKPKMRVYWIPEKDSEFIKPIYPGQSKGYQRKFEMQQDCLKNP